MYEAILISQKDILLGFKFLSQAELPVNNISFEFVSISFISYFSIMQYLNVSPSLYHTQYKWQHVFY